MIELAAGRVQSQNLWNSCHGCGHICVSLRHLRQTVGWIDIHNGTQSSEVSGVESREPFFLLPMVLFLIGEISESWHAGRITMSEYLDTVKFAALHAID